MHEIEPELKELDLVAPTVLYAYFQHRYGAVAVQHDGGDMTPGFTAAFTEQDW